MDAITDKKINSGLKNACGEIFHSKRRRSGRSRKYIAIRRGGQDIPLNDTLLPIILRGSLKTVTK